MRGKACEMGELVRGKLVLMRKLVCGERLVRWGKGLWDGEKAWERRKGL